MLVVRSGRPWYGCMDLVAAVSAAFTLLGLTIPFLAAQIGTTVSCELNAACEAPSWLTPASWAAWAVALIDVPVAIRLAAREAATGRRHALTRLAILVAFVCAGIVLFGLASSHGASPSD